MFGLLLDDELSAVNSQGRLACTKGGRETHSGVHVLSKMPTGDYGLYLYIVTSVRGQNIPTLINTAVRKNFSDSVSVRTDKEKEGDSTSIQAY